MNITDKLRASIALYNRVERELLAGGWSKSEPEWDKAVRGCMAFYRQFGGY